MSDCKVIGHIDVKGHEYNGRVYDPRHISPTVNAHSGGGLEVKIAIPNNTSRGFLECEAGGVADMSYPNSKTRRGRVQEGGSVSPTVTAESNGLCRVESQIRVRKLTPKECWRLMGFDDEDYEKAEKVVSNTQLYKQAGNGIVVDVLEAIFREML